MIAYATRLEFLRYVYEGGGASEATRNTYISAWREAAIANLGQSGVQTSASTNAHSVGFSTLPGWTPANVLELALWARGYISAATYATAAAEVPSRVSRYQTSITNLRVIG